MTTDDKSRNAVPFSHNAPPAWISLSALTLTTAVWGYSFLLVRDAVACYPVFLFLAVRFSLAALIMAPFLAARIHRLDRHTALGGFLLGCALFSGYAFQSYGLVWTTAAHSGFITGLFVVFTPLFHSILTRRPPAIGVWAAVALSTAGLALLSLRGNLGSMNIGDALSLVCAAVYAVHLLLTSHMAVRYDTASLVLVQIATVACLSWIFSLPAIAAGRLLPIPTPALVAIAVTALFATVFAYYVQTTFQKYTSAVQTAIIFTLEPVFAGLSAALFGGEHLGFRELWGGALIVGGMLVGQLEETRKDRRSRQDDGGRKPRIFS